MTKPANIPARKIKWRRSSDPSVFIIESVAFEDEQAGRREGSILSDLLGLSGKASAYFYLRTSRELEAVLDEFKRSRMRYLHISCHGDDGALETTLDRIPHTALAAMLEAYLDGRRLFISACDATNKHLAREVMGRVRCLSIIGPAGEVTFGDAATMWAAFYHLMFGLSAESMSSPNIRKVLETVATTFQVPFEYFPHSSKPPYFSQRTFSGKKIP
jgi:hypothetical protein